MVKTSTPNDDRQLWQAFKLGDEAAFTTLYQRHVRVLYSYGKKLLSNDDIVEDLIQDLFIDLWQNRHRLSDVQAPRYYLFRTLRRRIYKILPSVNTTIDNWENMPDGLLPVSLPEEFYIIEAENYETRVQYLAEWLKVLPIRQYEVLMLRYYQNFSLEEIADILSIHEQSVRNLLQRAVAKLRQLSLNKVFFILYLNLFLHW